MAEQATGPGGQIAEERTEERATGARMYIDWARAELVLGELLEAYEANEFPYNLDTVRLPHDPRHMPTTLERGSVDHAMFLVNLCYYMRGTVKSVTGARKLAEIYDTRPELFNCEIAAETDPNEIASVLKAHGLGFQNESIGGYWVENSRRIRDLWDGDPRRMFDGVNHYDQCIARIRNDEKGGGLLGFQHKMVSMVTYYLMDEGLIDEFVFPLPVDLHVMRVSIANELIHAEGYEPNGNFYTDETLRLMRELYYRYALDHGVSPIRLCNAVWLLSNAICSQNPGNQTKEPEGRANRQGRRTLLEPVVVDPSDLRQQSQYERACGRCPIEQTCLHNVPSANYYVSGELVIRGRRFRFPKPLQQELFPIRGMQRRMR